MAKTPQSHHSCHGRFSRPVNLLEAAPHITSDLLRLPTEILVEIFKGSDSLDRMCLALTCKYMLQVSSLVRIRIPSVNKHRFLPPSTCPHIFLLFRRIAVRDDRGRCDMAVGLCCDCLRRRTRRREFWEAYRGEWLKMGVAPKMWESAIKRWHDAYSFQCPVCWCRERYCKRSHKESY